MIRQILFFLTILCLANSTFAQTESVPEQTPKNAETFAQTNEVTDKLENKPQDEEITSKDASGDVLEKRESDYRNTALLQGLNKITARTSSLEVKLGEATKFGNLKITLHSCWKSPPEEEPDSKALLEVWEEISGEPRTKIFSGWMFASSPLISAPQHPVYDITLMECTGDMFPPLDTSTDIETNQQY